MQDKKAPYMRKPRRDELRVLRLFAYGLGVPLDAIGENIMVLEVPGSKFHDVFDVPVSVARSLVAIGGLYSAGFYLGMIDSGLFKPSLPLAWRLSRMCGNPIKCIVLDEGAARRFLYGRPVARGVVEWRAGLSIVVDRLGEVLGWGKGKAISRSGGTVKVVEPVWDLGWYLRRGG